MKFSNLGIASRLALGFGALIAVLMVVAGVGSYLAHRHAKLVQNIFDVNVQGALQILGAHAEVGNLRRFEKDMLLSVPDLDKVRGYGEKWRGAKVRVDGHLSAVRTLLEDQGDREALQGLSASLREYERRMEALEAEMQIGAVKTSAEAYRRVAAFRDAVRSADAHMESLYDSSAKRIDNVKPMLAAAEGQRQLNIGVGITLGLVLACLVAFLIARSITQPVAYAVQVAEALAKGDLTQTVEVRSGDELGRLMQALRGTLQQLSAIVGRIKDSSDKVNAASREIAQANLSLSTRNEEQASALEETSASMQQMSATVGQNAQNARTANELAVQAARVAGKGGQVVREAVGTMNGITDSSKKIADIIGVIDGIAFQTNILALNAAVEAARAGDQGRGFAVVASEVRSLAQRSAGAAKEIKTLITESVAKVDAGSRQVNEAGRTMEEIVSSVGKVNELIAGISKASEEQAQGIGQVTEAMTQLEQVTQQNAAMGEQATAAAASLEEQSLSMSNAVGAFRLTVAGGELPVAAPKRVIQPAAALRKRTDLKALPQGDLGWQTF
jgi:methyl-accepting chemotaxis protein